MRNASASRNSNWSIAPTSRLERCFTSTPGKTHEKQGEPMTKLPPGRFARLALKVNAFLLIAFVLAAGFIGLVSYKQGWFLHQSPIHFITPNALGLNKGMPVKLH